MSKFLADAEEILRVATVRAGGECMPDELAILIDGKGTIRMLDAAGWRIDSLQASYGVDTVYRVAVKSGQARLEGRSGFQSCVLEIPQPHNAARFLSTPYSYCVQPVAMRQIPASPKM